MPIHTYINAQTGETESLEMTGAELEEYLENTAKVQAELEAQNALSEQREAVYAKLGLTAQEVKLLLS